MAVKLALGVSSSVSIYKACEVLRGFQKEGCEVQVIMTANAARLVSPLLFSSLSGLKTITDMWEEPEVRTIAHVSLASGTALLCVAPATANVIGKFAGGVADDFLSTFFLAARCPAVVAPAMNEAMYLHPATQANLARLKQLGVTLVEPGRGYLACGTEGVGRLAEPEDIVRESLAVLAGTRKLAGVRVLVTAGPTREFLDPVRFISNPSSGRMGFELAAEAARRGAEVTLVSGPSALEPPAGARTIKVVTAAEMEKAVLDNFGACDVLIMAAAVSDFRFRSTFKDKLGKADVPTGLELEKVPDIVAKAAGRKRAGQLVIGFAAETGDLVTLAGKKLAAKRLDLIVANPVGGGRGFEADDNEAIIIHPSGKTKAVARTGKKEMSRAILDEIGELLGGKKGHKKGARRA